MHVAWERIFAVSNYLKYSLGKPSAHAAATSTPCLRSAHDSCVCTCACRAFAQAIDRAGSHLNAGLTVPAVSAPPTQASWHRSAPGLCWTSCAGSLMTAANQQPANQPANCRSCCTTAGGAEGKFRHSTVHVSPIREECNCCWLRKFMAWGRTRRLQPLTCLSMCGLEERQWGRLVHSVWSLGGVVQHPCRFFPMALGGSGCWWAICRCLLSQNLVPAAT